MKPIAYSGKPITQGASPWADLANRFTWGEANAVDDSSNNPSIMQEMLAKSFSWARSQNFSLEIGCF
jgi:hypothetical protein